MAQPTIETRLCPHCANSITADSLKCPYCKADLSRAPQWPEREDEPLKPSPVRAKERLTVKSKAILVLGLVVFALGVFLVGGQQERKDLGPILAQQQKELDEKERKVKNLEDQLAQLRDKAEGGASQLAQLKAKLEQSEKNLLANRKKLSDAQQEISRWSAVRVAPAARPARRTADTTAGTPAASSPRGGVAPGVYETVRPTTVFEQPDISSRIVTRISKATEVTVVRTVGEWVEVRSKHGNPPGFVRADDVALAGRGK
jgi:hypothetical protein